MRADNLCDTDMSVAMVAERPSGDVFPVSPAGGGPRGSATSVSLPSGNASAADWPSRVLSLNTLLEQVPVVSGPSRDAHRRLTGCSSQRDSSPFPPGLLVSASPPLPAPSPGPGALLRSSDSTMATQTAAYPSCSLNRRICTCPRFSFLRPVGWCLPQISPGQRRQRLASLPSLWLP